MKLTGPISFLSIMAIIFLVSAGPAAEGSDRRASVAVTPYSMDFYGYIAGARTGDILTVYDPDAVLCGQQTISHDGQYGFIHVYGDDPGTAADEGAKAGNVLTFKLNGEILNFLAPSPIRWMGDRERQRVDFTKP